MPAAGGPATLEELGMMLLERVLGKDSHLRTGACYVLWLGCGLSGGVEGGR